MQRAWRQSVIVRVVWGHEGEQMSIHIRDEDIEMGVLLCVFSDATWDCTAERRFWNTLCIEVDYGKLFF